jgi:hypothetical protein
LLLGDLNDRVGLNNRTYEDENLDPSDENNQKPSSHPEDTCGTLEPTCPPVLFSLTSDILSFQPIRPLERFPFCLLYPALWPPCLRVKGDRESDAYHVTT